MGGELVRGMVAVVLNERTLALNVGAANGVQEGMLFDVLSTDGKCDVVDPDTMERIGSIARPKVRVRVAQVGERVAIARTYGTVTVNEGGLEDPFAKVSDLARAFEPPKWVKRPITLESREMTWGEELSAADKSVKVGDVVVQVAEGMADIDIHHAALLIEGAEQEATP